MNGVLPEVAAPVKKEESGPVVLPPQLPEQVAASAPSTAPKPVVVQSTVKADAHPKAAVQQQSQLEV